MMILLFGEPKKFDGHVSFRLERSPARAALVDAKADRWQNLRIKTLGRFAIFYPEIDVIEKTRAHANDCSQRRAICPCT